MTRLLLGALLVCAATAQLPPIGDIHVYGVHKLTAEAVLKAAGIEAGGPLPTSKGVAEEKLAQTAGIAGASIQSVCCTDGRVTLYVGVQETGAPAPVFHLPPAGAAELPQEVLAAYGDFQGAILRAMEQGGDSDPSADPAVKGFEEQFSEFAKLNVDSLRTVLRDSWDHEQRKAAATLIALAPNKKAVLNDLLFAVQDPDPEVRENAIRAVDTIAAYALKHPALAIRVSHTPFIELLNSTVLSDREQAARVLLTVTSGNPPASLTTLRQRALPSLMEVARWNSPRYARAPFLLLARMAGVPDPQARQVWEKGTRDDVFAKLTAASPIKSTARPSTSHTPVRKRRK